MPERSLPLDYEDVSRSTHPKSWSDAPDPVFAGVDDWQALKRDESDDLVPSPGRKSEGSSLGSRGISVSSGPIVSADAKIVADTDAALGATTRSERARSERAVIKRGHALSFLCLFLFTADVYLRPYELIPALSFLKTSAFWIAFLTLLVYVPTQLGLEGKLTVKPREVKLVLLLLIAALLSIPLSIDPLKGWNYFLDYVKVIVMFVIMLNVVRTEKRLRGLVLLMVLSGCLFSVFAVNDYRLGKLILRGQRISGIVGGLFQNPNDLSLHLVTMIPLAVALMLGTRSLLKRSLYSACALLMISGVVVTFSRGGFLGLVSAGGVMAWKLGRKNRLAIGLVVPLALVLLIFLAPSGYGGRLVTTADGSALARQDDLKRSLFIALRHPLLGVGMDNYVIYSNSDHATHNAYTQVAAETGIPALIIYIMFLVTPLRQLGRIERERFAQAQRSGLFYMTVGLEASLVGYMVSSFFASVAFLWYAYYLVACAICLRYLYERSASSLAVGSQRPQKTGNSLYDQRRTLLEKA